MLGRISALSVIAAAALAFVAPARAGLSVLDNGTIRVGVDLDQGGRLTWLSRSQGEHADNLLLESEQSYWGGPFEPDYSPEWHGYQDPAAVIEHSNHGHTLYDRAVWAGCECSMQTWVTLHGNAVVVRNRLTSFRSDATAYAPGWQELPALYTVAPLYRIVTYDGSAPYRHAPLHDLTAQAAQFPFYTPRHVGVLASEHWEAAVDDNGFGIGLFEPNVLDFIAISSGDDGGYGGYPSGYISAVRQEILDANVVYDYTYTLVVGSVRQIRAYAYGHRPDPRPNYVFARDREHFTEINASDAGFPIAGALRLRVNDDPQLIGPEQEWPASRAPHLYIRGAWHTRQSRAELYWGRPSLVDYLFSEDRAQQFRVRPDGRFHTYRLDLALSPTYSGTIESLRLDPIRNGEPGAWVDITCISWKPCPIDRKAERRLETDGGLIPFLDTFDTLNTRFWSTGGNSTGVSTGVSDGELVIDVPPDAKPLPGQDYISTGVTSRCTLRGNFDVQADYRLKLWDQANGVNVNFSVGDRTLFRHNDPTTGESLASYFPPFPGKQISDPQDAESLRLVRTGDTVYGYYRNLDGDWTLLDSAPITTDPVNAALSIYTNRSPESAPEVSVMFDNFRVTRGVIECGS
jgi:hypothetical protein